MSEEQDDAPGLFEGHRVLITGAHGFLGRFVQIAFTEEGADVIAPTHDALELRDPSAVDEAFLEVRPHVVVHLAARVGGIGANQKHPGTFWRDNTLMGVNVLEAARAAEVERVVVIGTVCAYPKFTPVPFEESHLWEGFPEETNAPYGVAKRALATGMQAYRDEFGLAGAYLLPANLYGPGDNFDLESSHVIPAMIRKCEEARIAGRETVELWGTGTPSREFLYVEDCAEAILLSAARVDEPEPLNLGTGREVTMRELATLIATATGFEGTFDWNSDRPDGQPRRSLDVGRAREVLGWEAATSLEDGLAETVRWYRDHPEG
ncbi:MAG: GDP-L-fucose synthase [Planctomycetota bacterium]|nr:GDP-L-fucose synthase [Planctomycetota bacterium]